ncbi:MAG: HD family phosphohydrolase [Eubacteriales bacterium]|nr:HD family phosphohydrolase [Eubacteriales bacterium]
MKLISELHGINARKNRRRIREEAYQDLVTPYLKKEPICRMNHFMQHGTTTTMAHCANVARTSYMLNAKLRLHADEKALVRSAILHDFFLYDWHDGKPERKRHGFTHPEAACKNAMHYFQLTGKEKNVIRSHMWPLTIRSVPKCREAFIICATDKYCSCIETLKLNHIFGLRDRIEMADLKKKSDDHRKME